MLLLRLWNYIRGYVIIIIEGNFLEKFINICIHRQIFLWDIIKQRNNKMTLKMSIKGFLLLRPIAKKSGCKIRIKGKKGLPFFFNRYKGRKTFFFGGIIAIVAIYILTSFVWVIEVSGNKKIETQVIIDKISSFGVKPGNFKFSIDTKMLTNEMMLNVTDLAWISITVKGTKLKVSVTERINPPDLIQKDVPCDLIAKRDGVIKSVLAKLGVQKVKKGELVSKGDVLISGTITSESKDIKPYQVHALGNIYASTWYEKTCLVETRKKEKVRTGNVKNEYSLSLFTKRIKLFLGNTSLNDFEKVEIKKSISFGEDIELPFGLIIDKYYEEKIIEKVITLEEAKKIAIEKAYNDAAEEIPENVEIIKKNISFFKDKTGNLNADVIIECSEDIGINKMIGGN